MTEFDEQKYEFVLASDLINDGMALEVWDEESKELILLAFWSDANDSFTFTAFREGLPFGLVERFIQEARKRLPPPNCESENSS